MDRHDTGHVGWSMVVQYPGLGQWVLAGRSGLGEQEQDCFCTTDRNKTAFCTMEGLF